MAAGTRRDRIGILGGTLDPIHVGHLDAARAAQLALALHGVVLMPARIPPHRQQGPSASGYHRFAMAALAVNGLPGMTVSDEELCAEGPSFTALTLERLAARGMHWSRLFFITGADAFAEIATWYRYPAVLDLAHFVVISRPGAPDSPLADRVPELRGRLRTIPAIDEVVEAPSIFLVDVPTPDVSSTEIRRRLRAGEDIAGLVPGAVEEHIRQHHLYVEMATPDHLR